MKIVKIKKTPRGYAWDLGKSEQVECKCIIAIAQNRTIDGNDLIAFYNSGFITEKEFDAIRYIDAEQGKNNDLKIIKNLAKCLKVKVKVKNE